MLLIEIHTFINLIIINIFLKKIYPKNNENIDEIAGFWKIDNNLQATLVSKNSQFCLNDHMHLQILIVAKNLIGFRYIQYKRHEKKIGWIMKRGGKFFFFIRWHIWISFVVTKFPLRNVSINTLTNVQKQIRRHCLFSLFQSGCCCMLFLYIFKKCGVQSNPADRIFRKSLALESEPKESYKLFFCLNTKTMVSATSDTAKAKQIKMFHTVCRAAKIQHFTWWNRWKIVCLFCGGQPKCWLC